ncbi:23S rRNA (uracil(1939)-C(5))-methyltransferase RlmD [Neisseria lisongii]
MMNTNPTRQPTADVFSLDYEGRGVARNQGKTVFIKGALPGETVAYRLITEKKQFDEAQATAILRPSPQRVTPECRYFETCGGCVLQHIEPAAQVALKQRIWEEQLQRIGKVRPQQILPPIYGTPKHYRDRTRLSVGTDRQGLPVLGFRAKRSHQIVDIAECLVLPESVSAVLPDVKKLLRRFAEAGGKASSVEFYRTDEITVFNLIVEQRPSEKGLSVLKRWFDETLSRRPECWQIWLQQGKAAAQAFYPAERPMLAYELAEFGIRMPYRPGDFTQINADINQIMVGRALRWLDIQAGEKVADLFCGLGNFTLPMAKSGAEVVGMEGSGVLVQRAEQNAAANGCSNVRFQTADLFETTPQSLAAWGRFDKMLLDPPRSGAYAVVQALHEPYLPQKIVYVSCNPATFARDAAVLVEKGYVFRAAGIMNMFAQTAHVESMGIFERA